MDTRTVLIVDDDKIIREQLRKELKRGFFEVFLAADGKTALETVTQEEIGVVILDIKLPDMDGLEVLTKIKAKKPVGKVVLP